MTKRLTLFSFFDPKNEIDSYVIHYLEELHKISDIIFSTDCILSEQELEKVKHLTIAISNTSHNEYDFGSYKKAYSIAQNKNILQVYDWLIVANDSCYGPFYEFEPIFKKMEAQKINFWGFSHNTVDRSKHLQSYFVALDANCFLSSTFHEFINSIEKQEIRKNVVFKYEHGLTINLSKAGYTYNSYFEESPDKFIHDPAKNWDLMIQKGFPFIKRTLFTRNSYNLKNIEHYQKEIFASFPDYDLNLIKENLKKYTIKKHQSYLDKKFKKIKRWFK